MNINAFAITSLAGISTILGLFILNGKREEGIIPKALGFSAGVMIFVSLFDLLPSAIQYFQEEFIIGFHFLFCLLFILFGFLISILMNERKRYEKALEKLDNLYLFSESLLTPKEFANKRNSINENIEKINKEILDSNNENKNTFVSNDEFYSSLKASFFILSKYLSESKNIDGRHLLETVDMQILKDFIGKIISNIEINDKKIQNITFKNGITHHFIYK